MTRDLGDWVVLIIDDEPDNLEAIKVALRYFGAEVHTSTSGAEGLEILKELKPTMILLDLAMPEMNGWEVFQQIRSAPELEGLPVIAVTAHAMANDKERTLALGFDGYLTKPFRPSKVIDELISLVRS